MCSFRYSFIFKQLNEKDQPCTHTTWHDHILTWSPHPLPQGPDAVIDDRFHIVAVQGRLEHSLSLRPSMLLPVPQLPPDVLDDLPHHI